MSIALDIFLFLIANGIETKVSTDFSPPRFGIRDRQKVLTQAHRQAISRHNAELVALLTATRVDQEAACPVSPTGQHQWHELTSGEQKCLSCLVPMPTMLAHVEPLASVAANDTQTSSAA